MITTLTVTDNVTATELFAGTYRSRAAALAAMAEELQDWSDAHVLDFDASASDGGITGFKVYDVIRLAHGENVETVATAYLDIA